MGYSQANNIMERPKRRAGGRPPKQEQDLQNVVITVRVTGADHEAIKAAAEAREMPLSAYLRELGLGERTRSPGQAMGLPTVTSPRGGHSKNYSSSTSSRVGSTRPLIQPRSRPVRAC